MLEDKVKEILSLLPYNKYLTYKISAESVVTFYYESERYSRPMMLRSFHANNFDTKHKFYIDIEEVLSRIQSDYYYFDNKPVIK